MSPPSGRMPTTRNEWVFHWTLCAILPVIGWLIFGYNGVITFGFASVWGALNGAWLLLKQRRSRRGL